MARRPPNTVPERVLANGIGDALAVLAEADVYGVPKDRSRFRRARQLRAGGPVDCTGQAVTL